MPYLLTAQSRRVLLRRPARRLLTVLTLALAAVAALALPAVAGAEPLGPSSGTNPGSDVTVYAVLRIGSDIVIGGNFSSIISTNGTSHAAGGLAALNASTGAWAWSASLNGTTYALASDGTSIYVGGAYGVRKFSQSGAALAFKRAYPLGTVQAVAASRDEVFYGGQDGVAGRATSGAGKWRVTAANVRSLALSGSRLLVGGGFCTIGGVSRPTLASLSEAGSVTTGFDARRFSCTNGRAQPALAIAVSGGVAFIGGGGTLNRVVAVSASTGATAWQGDDGDGDVQAVTVQGGDVYIGGHFDCVDGNGTTPCLAVRYKAARYSTSGVLDPRWTPVFSGGPLGVWALAGGSGQVDVGGVFTSINGTPREKFAIFTGS